MSTATDEAVHAGEAVFDFLAVLVEFAVELVNAIAKPLLYAVNALAESGLHGRARSAFKSPRTVPNSPRTLLAR
jgi:hypothetical protein